MKKKALKQNIDLSKLSQACQDLINKELSFSKTLRHRSIKKKRKNDLIVNGLYEVNDRDLFISLNKEDFKLNLFTIDELLAKDKQREEDGFPRRIRLGKYIKPIKGSKEKIVVVPTTTEPKFYHDDSITEDGEENTGGSGDGEEGEVLGEQQAEPQEGEGEGQGAGQGEGSDHDLIEDAFDLGKVITKKFELPNLKPKGKKLSTNKYVYDLTDINRGFGQYLDKKATIKRIIETNIMLDKLTPGEEISPEKLIINPQDQIFRILSKEKDFEAQAVVFFVRDYSGSMMGEPTEAVVMQHLFIYSWLMYQYQNQVSVRFILHDSDAKEVPDFYTYYKSNVAGGTNVFPAYELVADIIEKEHLHHDNNIYIFHGTDGDDWDEDGEKAITAVRRFLPYISRMGITVAKNSWGSEDRETTVEKYFNNSGLLKEKHELIRMDGFAASQGTEERIIEGIKKLTS
ncbi:MAG TPA: DUF444 family protein [Bacteroidales bacterium]|nr:DUF444 family protein [Bacteroidales bacterium]